MNPLKKFLFGIKLVLIVQLLSIISLYGLDKNNSKSEDLKNLFKINEKPKLNSLELTLGSVFKYEKSKLFPELILDYERRFTANKSIGLKFGLDYLLTNEFLHFGFGLGLTYRVFDIISMATGPKLIYDKDRFEPAWFISFGKMFQFNSIKLGPSIEYTQEGRNPAIFFGLGVEVDF